MRQSKVQKREIVITLLITIFFIEYPRFGDLFPPSLGFETSVFNIKDNYNYQSFYINEKKTIFFKHFT